MALTIDACEGAARCGVFTGGAHSIATPAVQLLAAHGSPEHVVGDVLASLPHHKLVHVPLRSLATTPEPAVLGEFGSYSEFAHLQDFAVFVSSSDPTQAGLDGFNEQGGVALWNHAGRQKMTTETFSNLHSVGRFDVVAALSDVQSAHASRKRHTKAVERTQQFLGEAVQTMAHAMLLAPIVGGAQLDLRLASAKHAVAAAADVQGRRLPVAQAFEESLTSPHAHCCHLGHLPLALLDRQALFSRASIRVKAWPAPGRF
eukprot:m.175377 g.175377  ORF g.175377 m.175377 type:complete len:259 (+) comp10421_c0_seq2:1784-2560(+)